MHQLADDRFAQSDIQRQVCSAGFPNRMDAMAYTVSHVIHIAASTLAFESIRRNPPDQADTDWRMDASGVRAGIDLAEEGLAEEVSEIHSA